MILLAVTWGYWLSWAVFYGEFFVNLVLDALLLRILYRQGVRKQLPWFVLYISWQLVSTAVGFGVWVIDRPLYVTVFWWMEAARVALLVGAVREALLRIFRGFESLLRWSILALLGAVIFYSAWRVIYAPPVQSNRIVSFILAAEFGLRWGIAGASLVSMVLMWSVQEPRGSREDAVITGAGIASMGFVAWVIIRSFFGRRVAFFAQYLPDVGYFVAVFYWIKIFQRPIERTGFKELGMQPDEIRKGLRNYGELVELIKETVRKIW